MQADKKVLEASLEDPTSEADRAEPVAGTPVLQAGRETPQEEARYCAWQL